VGVIHRLESYPQGSFLFFILLIQDSGANPLLVSKPYFAKYEVFGDLNEVFGDSNEVFGEMNGSFVTPSFRDHRVIDTARTVQKWSSTEGGSGAPSALTSR
jgi:hypothetical protein